MIDITLYAILDPEHCLGRSLPDLARQAAKGGATVIQYRDKRADTRKLVENARAIRAALEGSGVPLLINDRVDVALASGADGVHVGQSDMDVRDARLLIGNERVVGLTIKTPEDANNAPLSELDYVCIGGVFQTSSKRNSAPIGIDGWSAIARHFRANAPDLPVGAIAGIDAANAPSVMKAGADGVAVISAIFKAENVERATRDLKTLVATP